MKNEIENKDCKKHLFNCSICGQKVDMRDLVQFIRHEHIGWPDNEKLDFQNARRAEESTEWFEGIPFDID